MPDTYDRHGPRDRHLRVGDAEREAVAGILRAQYVAGRLDSSEFEQRLERCLAAKTYADLDTLLTDFPGLEQPPRRRRPLVLWRLWPVPLLPVAVVAAIVLSGGHALFLVDPARLLLRRPAAALGPPRRLGLRARRALGRPARDRGRQAAGERLQRRPVGAPCSGFSSVTVSVATRGSATSVSSAASADASGTPTLRPVFCDSGASVKSMTSTSKWTAMRSELGRQRGERLLGRLAGIRDQRGGRRGGDRRAGRSARAPTRSPGDSSKPSSDSSAGCSGSAGTSSGTVSSSPSRCATPIQSSAPSVRARRRVHVAVHVEVEQAVAGRRRERADGAEADRAVAAEHQREPRRRPSAAATASATASMVPAAAATFCARGDARSGAQRQGVVSPRSCTWTPRSARSRSRPMSRSACGVRSCPGA